MVLVIFAFAQEDSKKIEKLYLENPSSATSSLDQTENQEPGAKTEEIKQFMPAAQFR
jgi:hypothetical protein